MAEVETVEELAKRPEVKKELRQTAGNEPAKKVKAKTTDKFWFVTHGLLLLGLAVLYYFVGLKFISLSHAQVDLADRLIRRAAVIIIVLAAAKAGPHYPLGPLDE